MTLVLPEDPDLTQLPSHSLCSPALASLILNHARLAPASEALHWLFLWSAMLFLRHPHDSVPHLKHHLRAILIIITNYPWVQFSFSFSFIFPHPTISHLSEYKNYLVIYFLSISPNYKLSAVKVGNLVLYLLTQDLNYSLRHCMTFIN